MKKLALVSNNEFEMLEKLTEEDYKCISDNIHFLINFDGKNSEIDKLFEIVENILSDLSRQYSTNLIRLLTEYYSNSKSFLDYWETNLKREFGKNSIQYQKFQTATQTEYSNLFEYRFSYELRNYIQHCGFPNVHYRSYLNKNGELEITLELEVKEIINSFKWKPAVKKDLLEKEKIDLKNVILEHINSIERIHNIAMTQYDLKQTLKKAKKILEFETLQKDNKKLACLNLPKNYPSQLEGEISILMFPFQIAHKLLNMINEK